MKTWKAILAGAMLLGGMPLMAPADTIYFKDGQSIDCVVHEEKKIWKDIEDPNFYEIEIASGYIGFWDEGQVDRIEKNDNFVRQDSETQAMMRELIKENRLILPSAMIEGGLMLPEEMSKPVTGRILEVKNYAFSQPKGLDQKLRLERDQEFRVNQTISTARNSRLKFAVGSSIVCGLLGGSAIDVAKLGRAEHLSTDEAEFDVTQGQMYIAVNPREIGGGVKDRIQMRLSDCTFRPEQCLLHVEVTADQQFRLTLLEGDTLNVRVRGTPSGGQIQAGETLIVPLAGEKLLTSEPAREGLLQTWQDWDQWKPETIAIEPQLMPGLPESAPMLGEHSALSGDFGGQQIAGGADLVTESLPAVLKKYREALDLYKEKNGNYPDPSEGLKALRAGSEDPYRVLGLPLTDPWGRELLYDLIEIQNQPVPVIVSVRSAGPNGLDEKGLGDDVQ